MVITAMELGANLSRYLSLASRQDILITENGKAIAKLSSPAVDKIAILDSLVGITPPDDSDIREERLSRQ